MQTEQYVELICQNPSKQRIVHIYLLEKNSKYSNSSQDLKKLLNRIKNPTDVILICYKPLNTYSKKTINTFKHLNIYTYLHEIFDLVIPNGPLCYPHRIMSREEVLKLCNDDLFCYLTNLPKIFDEDPQCIWIGAESGDVIEIKFLSDLSGEAVQYRVCVPKSGRLIYKQITEAEPEVQAAESKNTEDEQGSDSNDDLLEHREMNAGDSDYLSDGSNGDGDEYDGEGEGELL
jgi:DNA-directed RNA polymerase subunit H (RpoH/RPB5)